MIEKKSSDDNLYITQSILSNIYEDQSLPKYIRDEALYYATDGEIDKATQLFETWSNYPEYIILKRTKRGSFKNEFVLVKASKRGNDVYQSRIKKRFRNFFKCGIF